METNKVLEEFSLVLEKETNSKIKQGMQLFINSDNNCRAVFLHGTGFKGHLTVEALREHFESLDLLETLDIILCDMKENVQNS